MSIIQNITAEVPNNITDCLALLDSVTTPLMNTLMAYKSYFIEFNKQTDALYASSKKILDALEVQVSKEQKRIQQHPRAEKPAEIGKRKALTSQPAKTQAGREPVKIQSNSPKPPSNPIIPKRLFSAPAKMEKCYICFNCFRKRNNNNSQSYMWQNQSFYLSHLKQKHKIVPNLDVLLLTPSNIPFSHVYIQDQLVNIFSNSSISLYLELIQSYKMGDKSKMYVCGCLQDEDETINLQKEPIFANSTLFFEHLESVHNGECPRGSSHILCKHRKEKLTALVKVNRFETILTHPKLSQIIQNIEALVQQATNCSIASLLVETNPLSRLEMISRLRLEWTEAFLPLPDCSSSQPTLKDLMSDCRNDRIPEAVKIAYLSEEENRLVNLQISLLNPELFICGGCEQRIESGDEFVSHIYLKHKTTHALNSHRLQFLPS